MQGTRILITGVSSTLGGRVAQELERDPAVEAVIGVDTRDPRHELQRTEFVRVALQRRPLRRIVRAAAIDTVIDTRLIADPIQAGLGTIRAVDLEGTDELLAACTGPDCPVRSVVFKSSAHVYGWEAGGPAFLTEDMARAHPPRSAVERILLAAERSVLELAGRRPKLRVVIVRLAEEIGVGERSSLLALLGLPVVPSMLGWDPRLQFVHADDVVGALVHAARGDVPAGAYNVAGDGVLVLSEVAALLGKPLMPLLPPWGAGFAAERLRRLGLRMPVEMLRQLRYGRGLDNRRLKTTGYVYRYTSREAVVNLRADQRQRLLLGRSSDAYRYESDLEEFLRWSPSVRSAPGVMTDTPANGGLDALAAGELIDLIPSLEPEALRALHEYERAHQRRADVLEALESTLERKEG